MLKPPGQTNISLLKCFIKFCPRVCGLLLVREIIILNSDDMNEEADVVFFFAENYNSETLLFFTIMKTLNNLICILFILCSIL